MGEHGVAPRVDTLQYAPAQPLAAKLVRAGRRWFLTTLAVVVLLALAALLGSMGLLGYERYSWTWTTRSKWSFEVRRSLIGDQRVDLGGVAFKTDVVAAGDKVVGQSATDALCRHMLGTGSGTGRLTVHLSRLEVDDAWSLGQRQAICRFSARFVFSAENDPSNARGFGRLDGQVDCTVDGVCSPFTLRKLLGERVATELAGHLKERTGR